MSYFEYQAIYFGIIVGLALSNILTSVHKLVEAGHRVKWGWLAPMSAGYAATLTLGEFWFVWLGRNSPGLHTILSWFPLALAFALLFLMCAASLPDDAGEAGLDLRRYYVDNRYRFWGFAAMLHALNLLTWMEGLWTRGFSAPGVHAALPAVLGNSADLVLSLTLIFVRATWWNVLLLVAMWAEILLFFGPMSLT